LFNFYSCIICLKNTNKYASGFKKKDQTTALLINKELLKNWFLKKFENFFKTMINSEHENLDFMNIVNNPRDFDRRVNKVK